MNILIVTPAPPGTRLGNRVTALRWQGILRSLGHRVTIAQAYTGQKADVLIALHAQRSHPAVRAFHRRFPGRPILVTLTGTDIYGTLKLSAAALDSMAAAFRIIALQPLAALRIPARHRRKVRTILQSFPRRRRRSLAAVDSGVVAVIGHLRTVKDPLRAALAVRGLPRDSTLRVVHLGSALSPAWAARARAEMRRNSRYRWLGSVPERRTSALLAGSALLVVSSRSEGGANVISEAVGLGIPVLASRVPGNVGLLGARYPGYFTVGDTQGLRRLLARYETRPDFRTALHAHTARLVPRFEPAQERERWQKLLLECQDSTGMPGARTRKPRANGRVRTPQRRN